jgi:hypothetical protein
MSKAFFDDIVSFSISKEGFASIKSCIIWANKTGVSRPIMYIRKPKYLTKEQFDEILNSMELSFKKESK